MDFPWDDLSYEQRCDFLLWYLAKESNLGDYVVRFGFNADHELTHMLGNTIEEIFYKKDDLIDPEAFRFIEDHNIPENGLESVRDDFIIEVTLREPAEALRWDFLNALPSHLATHEETYADIRNTRIADIDRIQSLDYVQKHFIDILTLDLLGDIRLYTLGGRPFYEVYYLINYTVQSAVSTPQHHTTPPTSYPGASKPLLIYESGSLYYDDKEYSMSNKAKKLQLVSVIIENHSRIADYTVLQKKLYPGSSRTIIERKLTKLVREFNQDIEAAFGLKDILKVGQNAVKLSVIISKQGDEIIASMEL